MSEAVIIAEPFYILLASLGHPDAHECVRRLTIESLKANRSLSVMAMEEESLKPYLEKFTDSQKEIVSSPSKYTGIASKKAERVIEFWQRKLKEIGLFR